jgi:hypothetical protein
LEFYGDQRNYNQKSHVTEEGHTIIAMMYSTIEKDAGTIARAALKKESDHE